MADGALIVERGEGGRNVHVPVGGEFMRVTAPSKKKKRLYCGVLGNAEDNVATDRCATR